MTTPATKALAPSRSRQVCFNDLPVGTRFRFPHHLPWCFWRTAFEFYFKTGAGSYGTSPGEPLWPWVTLVPYVEVEG
jgi:hypothetical protein